MGQLREKRVKICFFIGNMSHSGGTERVLAAVANGLLKRGYRVAVISLWGGGKTVFPLERGIKLYWLQERAGSHNVVRQLRCLSAVLRREEPDFWVDVDIILAVYSVFLKIQNPGLRWIAWEHFNFYHRFQRNRLLRKMARKTVCRFADQLVVLTDADREHYRNNMRLGCAITRIYNPIPYEGDFEKEKEEPVILAVGRLARVKGYDLLIRSWKLLERKYPEWSVMIAGEGEERKRLEWEAEEEGLARLHFIGNVYPVEEYYRRAALLVLPSRDEGFGMVLIEAMYHSLPVVSYSCRSGPGEIVEDGRTGFLVEPGHVKAFAKRMEELMRDGQRRRRMGERAQISVNRFDREEILAQWEAMLRSLL